MTSHPDVNKICLGIVACLMLYLLLAPTWATLFSVALTIYLLIAATNSIRDAEIAAEQAQTEERKRRRRRK